jgi:hypothetical protein
MVSGTSGLRDTGGNLYADGRRGRNKDYLSPVEANYDFYFKLWLLVQDEAIPYLWFGPGVVGVHGANITLSEGATVDGVDVSTLSNAFAALEHAYQLENRRLWGRVQRLERRLAALEAQVDLDLTEHITH